MTISCRSLRSEDFPRLAHWQASPHVARWWRRPADLASITAEYAPSVEGLEPAEVFVIELDGQPVGIIQRYLLADYPGWAASLNLRDGVGIDYYLGEPGLTGQGLGSQTIAQFAQDALTRYPEATKVVAAPQQENVASWRALEKAGFERVWAGQLDSDDPSDAGPAYVYCLQRDGRPPLSLTTGAAISQPLPYRIPQWRHPNHRDPSSLPAELRRTTVPTAVQAWITRMTRATVVRSRRLPGASSTAVRGLYLSDGRRLVLRRYVWPGFLASEPVAPRRELDALEFGFAHGLAVPQVVAADITGEEVGDAIPALLMTFLAGRALVDPDLDKLAEVAARIHTIDPAGFAHDYFPWYQGSISQPPPASSRPQLWETAIDLWHNATPPYQPAFIHRDFHPGNVLWSRGRASGVVDWANACRGPRGCDLAHCRANLIDLTGPQAADRFLAAYESLTGETHHPYWEMASILEHGPSHWSPARLAEQEPYLLRAVRSIAVS
jgi:RimJ/RimL family protein N-acetyltransferase/aminoglycoside phosphotransferase (APT) family kinase protein